MAISPLTVATNGFFGAGDGSGGGGEVDCNTRCLEGSSAGSSSATAHMLVPSTISLLGATNGIASTSAIMGVLRGLKGSSAGSSTTTATMEIAVYLMGSSGGSSAITVAMEVDKSLTGSVSGKARAKAYMTGGTGVTSQSLVTALKRRIYGNDD